MYAHGSTYPISFFYYFCFSILVIIDRAQYIAPRVLFICLRATGTHIQPEVPG
ncbi:hypothetical protein L211DRAFT_339569 [Terfezia boudieri ATCC MYA-4762]|uniref:Uncharacterized protein n=1 Tax=Terfezia boudieri ATCC MYA-4762 TaxID=1051890 RepID=A0A3N4LH34_9PEZI|nr:hypothetical protein L211DRAFT_339569 [Terfezia boudieri ATCC MYA-4762]